MHILKNWTARRAGARITVNGDEADGKPSKIVGVDLIEAQSAGFPSGPLPRDLQGVEFLLVAKLAYPGSKVSDFLIGGQIAQINNSALRHSARRIVARDKHGVDHELAA
jgi:hypothetical protein